MTRDSTPSIRNFFEPGSVAVAGVSPNADKLASIIFANLQGNVRKGVLKARLYALNPAHGRIGGATCYPTIGSLPEVPNLLIVAVPAAAALQLVTEAADAGVKAVIMITGGFAEIGRGDLQAQVLRKARAKGMRIMGPNTIGLVDTLTGVDSLFLRQTKSLPDGGEVISHLKPFAGGVVIVTQSGHLGETVSEELTARGVGVRALVGTGNQLDVSAEDIIGYFENDRRTKVIAVYTEGVADGRKFMRMASAAARKKPVVVLKVGKTGAGARAALTHTASLVGDYAVYEAAFRRSGLVEAKDLQELIDGCVAFSMFPRATGKRVAIITNAGGVGAIAAEEAERSGLEVNPPDKNSLAQMRRDFRDSSFISNASLGNPLDLTATATTAEFVRMTELALRLPDYDMALVMPTHQTPSIDYDISGRLARAVSKIRKPVSVCVMGWSDLARSIRNDLARSGIPTFPTPERGVRALAASAAYWSAGPKGRSPADPSTKDRLPYLKGVRGPLPPSATRKLLDAYEILQPKSVIVRSERDLPKASAVGFPVACKLLSSQLLHKSGAGGVMLGVRDRAELVTAFSRLRRLARQRRLHFEGMIVQEMVGEGVEIILGGTLDPTFGPTVLFGAGGKHAEIMKDYSVAVAPVIPKEARELILRTKLSRILEGYRSGAKVDVDALCQTISRFSRIMMENPSIREMEINPLTASQKRILAVDTRVLLAPRLGARLANSSDSIE